MQKIEAIINSARLPLVRSALEDLGITGMSVLPTQGLGRENGYMALYRGFEYWVDLLPKIKIEVIVEDIIAEDCIAAIAKAARSGQIGDGKIFISPISRAIRIRTGEEGKDAL